MSDPGPQELAPFAWQPVLGIASAIGRPTDDGATVVAVRFTVAGLAPYFDRCTQVATVDNGHDVDNEVQGQPILVCRGLRGDWTDTWKRMRFLS